MGALGITSETVRLYVGPGSVTNVDRGQPITDKPAGMNFPYLPPPVEIGPPLGRPKRGPYFCQMVSDYRAGRWPQYGAVVEEKLDGIRALWVGGRLATRNGADLPATESLWSDCEKLAARFDGEAVLDGEWIEPGGLMATKAVRDTRGKGLAIGRYVVWDALPVAAWAGREHSRDLLDRRHALEMAFAKLKLTRVHLMPMRRIWEEWEAMEYAREVWARGGEGVVVKDPRSRYTCTRDETWQRIKWNGALETRRTQKQVFARTRLWSVSGTTAQPERRASITTLLIAAERVGAGLGIICSLPLVTIR